MAGTALLVMDVQRAITEGYRAGDEFFGPLTTAVAAARGERVPVVYVVVRFRPGYPEISMRNKLFSAIRAGSRPIDLTDETAVAVDPRVAPADGELVVAKRRVSAFAGSDLDTILRAAEVDALALAGIATSGVVLSTLRQAADLDYDLTVLSDCCLDGDDDVQRVLLEKVFPTQAEVTTAAEWAGSLIA